MHMVTNSEHTDDNLVNESSQQHCQRSQCVSYRMWLNRHKNVGNSKQVGNRSGFLDIPHSVYQSQVSWPLDMAYSGTHPHCLEFEQSALKQKQYIASGNTRWRPSVIAYGIIRSMTGQQGVMNSDRCTLSTFIQVLNGFEEPLQLWR